MGLLHATTDAESTMSGSGGFGVVLGPPSPVDGRRDGSIIMWVVRPKKQVSTLCIIEGAGSGITSLTRFDSTHHIAWHRRRARRHVDALPIESIAPLTLMERPDRDAT